MLIMQWLTRLSTPSHNNKSPLISLAEQKKTIYKRKARSRLDPTNNGENNSKSRLWNPFKLKRDATRHVSEEDPCIRTGVYRVDVWKTEHIKSEHTSTM